MSIHVHGVSAFLVTIDAFLVSNEWEWKALWIPIVFGTIWTIWSVIYWFVSNGLFIYKIFDWHNPGSAMITYVQTAAMVIIIHTILWFAKKLQTVKVHAVTNGVTNAVNSQNINITKNKLTLQWHPL